MRNRLLKTLALFALLATVFAGCKKEPTYTVRVSATEGGTVEGQNGEYEEGDTIVFRAIPADGYYFSYWSDYKDDNPRTITVGVRDITITAKFIGVNPKEGGTVETKKEGDTFVLTAIPTDGYCFSQWSDGNINNPREITVGEDDISFTAEFAKPTIATVDLGLKSGTLWATCNIGAANPWNYGDYYAWGETQTKDDYSLETYKYCKGSEETLTKYCYDADFGNNGFTDALTTLEVADDAATAALGAGWAMPTDAEWMELDNQCYWVWTENYNNRKVCGYIVYKPKSADDKGTKVYDDGTPSASYSLADAHIFLPAAGDCYSTNLFNAGSGGFYWSASLYDEYPFSAWYIYFGSSFVNPFLRSDRCVGYSVRPVKRS